MESAANRWPRGQASLANRVRLFGTDSLLKCQGGMECDGIRTGIRDRVCQKNDLNLLLGEAAAVDLLKHANQGVDKFR
ncbi:MAG TPA: hypothetical protein VK593_01375 [Edaphobacter sp.]|nr:hypothetical protein [Edaphobacter sp.]